MESINKTFYFAKTTALNNRVYAEIWYDTDGTKISVTYKWFGKINEKNFAKADKWLKHNLELLNKYNSIHKTS